jgi:NRPS condensation-like uncharacterized protein
MGLIRSYAREKGATMNDVILTAFSRSIFTICDLPFDQPSRIEVPVSLRRYLPHSSERTICNLAAAYFLNIDRKEAEEFEGTLARVHEKMMKEKNNCVELAEMFLLELVTMPGMFLIRSIMGGKQFNSTRPTLTNLGIVDHKLADFSGTPLLEVREVGPMLFPPNFMIGTISFKDRMTFSLTFYDSAVDVTYMERFFDLFVNELPGRELGFESRCIPATK